MATITPSKYWQREYKSATVDSSELKPGKTFSAGRWGLMCDECCNKDGCDTPSHYYRPECPHCLGTGSNASCYNEQGELIIESK